MATLYTVKKVGEDQYEETVEEVKPNDGIAFTLQEMYELVGSPVEILPLPSGLEIVVNENGKLTGLPQNFKATEVWKKEYPIEEYPDNNDQLIVGNALIGTPREFGSDVEAD